MSQATVDQDFWQYASAGNCFPLSYRVIRCLASTPENAVHGLLLARQPVRRDGERELAMSRLPPFGQTGIQLHSCGSVARHSWATLRCPAPHPYLQPSSR
jgi:hypothetical protein